MPPVARRVEGSMSLEIEGFTVWLTGLSGAGKTTQARLLREALIKRGLARVELLDSDVLRTHLWWELGFSREDRIANIERIGWIAELLSRNNIPTIVAAISPYRDARDRVRASIKHFVEVHVHCPLEECERRDAKGLYRKARAGEITSFTGIDSPYDAPINPEVKVETHRETPQESCARILAALERRGLLPRER